MKLLVYESKFAKAWMSDEVACSSFGQPVLLVTIEDDDQWEERICDCMTQFPNGMTAVQFVSQLTSSTDEQIREVAERWLASLPPVGDLS